MNQDYSYIERLIFRYINGEITATELQELQEWRKEKESHEELFRRITDSEKIREQAKKCILPEDIKQQEWENIRTKTVLREKKKQQRRIRICQYAAVACLFAGVSVFLSRKEFPASPPSSRTIQNTRQQNDKDIRLTFADGKTLTLSELANDSLSYKLNGIATTGDTLKYQAASDNEDTTLLYNSLSIPQGTEYHLVLSDGTIVYLNAESKLSYPTAFKSKTREVWLEGEAYFQVSKNKEQPFIVHAGEVNVKVLGTSFGIRAYEDENQILTTLVTGAVQVDTRTVQVLLSPSEQAICSQGDDQIQVQTVNTELYTGWINGRFIFENETLDAIITKLQKWYDFEVFYTQDRLRELPFSVNIVKYDKYTEFFKVIEKTKTVRFEIKGKSVLVKPW